MHLREPVTTPEALQVLVQEVRAALATVPILSFDTEFLRESTFFPRLELLQLGTLEETWIVDIQAFRPSKAGRVERITDLKPLAPLIELLEDPSILKVGHALQSDQECLYWTLGMTAKPAVDTAIAASLLGMGESIGLAKLHERVLDVELPKGHSRTNWGQRPIPPPLLKYAHQDVEFMVELWLKMRDELDRQGRTEWVIQNSKKFEAYDLYDPLPEKLADEAAKRARLDSTASNVLRELVMWREKRVRETNVPRRWVVEDGVLVDLAKVQPQDAEHLLSFRGINKGEVKHQGAEVLKAIQRGIAAPAQNRPKRGKRVDVASEDEEMALELMKCFLYYLGRQHSISPRALLEPQYHLQVLRSDLDVGLQGWVEQGWMTEAAARTAGAELHQFLLGKISLSLDTNQKVVLSNP